MAEEVIGGSTILMGITGKYVDPLDLKVGDVDVRDIAHHLGNQCRYSGATREFYSVGQHAVLCAREGEARGLPLDVVYTLLHHDDGEAYLQDVARPLKEDPYFGKAYRGAEKRAEPILAEALSFMYPFPAVVKEIDTILLATERRDLMPSNGRWAVLDGVEPLAQKITAWSPKKARFHFIQTHERLANAMMPAVL